MSFQEKYTQMMERPKGKATALIHGVEPQRKLTSEERTLGNFKEAYKKVYGVYPIMEYTNGFYRVKGYSTGMSLKRLRELTTILKHRAKDK